MHLEFVVVSPFPFVTAPRGIGKHGYFQIPLDEEASRLTTFILPSGRFRYLRAPMGLSSSSDEWCRHSDRVVEGFPWCKKIVDDILIWASTMSELDYRISQVVQRCRDLHITLSKSKFQIDTTLKFAGCVVSSSGVTPDPDRVSAQVEFDTLKTILSSNLIVRHFDKDKPVYLLTDASRLFGLGYALGHMETDASGKDVFKIVKCGSKGLTPTQQRYSTIELECLAICLLYTSDAADDP